MASACVNNIGMSSENFYGWLSPRISFSRDFVDDGTMIAGEKSPLPAKEALSLPVKPDLEASAMDLGDFEFRLEDPVTMLPADELFYDGKLVPLQLNTVRQISDPISNPQIRSPDALKLRRRAEILGSDPYVFSPKAPRCSSRWRELLGLKRVQNPKPDIQKTSSLPSKNPNPKSLKHFLHRNANSSRIDSSLSLPLLRESDSESVSISYRLSLSSSSSSGPDHEDLPRLSLDSDKPSSNPLSLNKNPPRVRVSKPRTTAENPRPIPDHPTVRIGRSPIRRAPDSNAIPARGVSVDSPRMNSSGKIVFQSLERSSSSPSSFNGGPRHKIRGVERSYSANVRITPVLNVPVCSLRGSSKSGSVFGLGQLFSPQKKEAVRSNNGRNRNDRI
ncbi:TPRXL [Tasmannia lanceolata]|uniref:TPRXL n=1 Tax=Tasmannia lanceolata TaxID=3420 RepID=UPI00406316C0